MAEADWTFLTGGLSSAQVDNGVTAGVVKPNGGGDFLYGFNSLEVIDGVVGRTNTQVGFAPMPSGGSVRGAVKRGVSGAKTGFAPFLYIGLQGPDVSDAGYLLGLGDNDDYHIVLRKGVLTDGLPDGPVDPDASPNVLMRSSAAFTEDTWLHLRLDMIVQGSGDVVLQVAQNDLDSNPVTAPVWAEVPGMEGPQSPSIKGFIDDSLGVNTGSAPFTSGRAGYAIRVEDVTRRGFFDHMEVARQT